MNSFLKKFSTYLVHKRKDLTFNMPTLLKLAGPHSLEQKNAELQALNEQLRYAGNSRLHQVIESAPNGLLMMDQHGKIVLCNAQIEFLFGYRREELFGMKIEILIPERFRQKHPDYRTGYFVKPETRQMGAGRDLSGLRKDGTEFPVEIGLNPVRTDEGQFVLASIIDITERNKIAKELLDVKESAEAANLAKSAFLANMSHEIRTPLGAMMGFADLIIDPQVGPSEKANFVTAIRSNGELLSNIINDILDLSKIEAGKMQIVAHEVALTEILTDTKTLLNLQARDKGIALNILFDENLPEIIRTDSLRLRQVLINIIGNAVKFTSKGAVDVRIKREPSQNRHDLLVFIVKDSGCGISEDQAAKLFAPFSQADASSKRKYGGTGLGLVLSKRFANLLGGDVVLTQSTLDKGSTFTITVDPGPIQSVEPETVRETTPIPFHGEQPRLDGIKILLAEDSPDNQLVVSRFLMLAGATVDAASNGKEAVEKAKKDQYDVILMDLQMPIMDGFEATAELRKEGYKGKIVALTAHTLSDDREGCLRSGFDEHIGKPVNRNALIEVVERLSKRLSA